MSPPPSAAPSKSPTWPGWPDDEPTVSVAEKDLNGRRRILKKVERQWLQVQPWLQSQGYLLRPRFRPGWTPSWDKTKRAETECEDSIEHSSSAAIDAVQISTGRRVCLKRIPMPAEKSSELDISQFLSEDGRQDDPRNHAVPLLDVIRAPDHCFLVFPLYRALVPMREKFTTLGEMIDFVEQTLEGLAYLHELGIAHRDCAVSNIVMEGDRMFPHGFHPDSRRKDARGRTLRGVRSRTCAGGAKYYLIDFGESMKFDSTDNVRIDVWSKASIHAPETLGRDRPPYDPFKVDMWAMGSTYAKATVQEYPAYFDAFSALFDAMAADDPGARPSAVDALVRFRAIKSQYSRTALQARVRHGAREEAAVQRLISGGWHWVKQLAFAARNRTW